MRPSRRSGALVRSLKRSLAVAEKEWMHLARDPLTVLFALGMPVVLLLLFGFAVSFDVDGIRTAVVDEDGTRESRAFAHHLFSGPTFVKANRPASAQDGEAFLRTGDAQLVVVIPRGYGDAIGRGQEAPVQLLVDAADNTTASSVLSYAGRYAASTNEALVKERGLAFPDAVEARVRALYNPSMRSVVFLAPGLIALIQAMMTVVLTAVTVAREWERGSMEQLFATPVRRGELVIGKLLPYFAVSMVQLLLVLVAGTSVFDMPVRGSLVLLVFVSVLFSLAGLAQGLLVSVVTRNLMVATQVATISTMLPAMLLSGFIMPVDNMPWALRLLTNVVPARHFVHALRAILLRGAGFSVVAGDIVFLVAFTAVVLSAALAKFGRRLS